jgi:hypothetical protein
MRTMMLAGASLLALTIGPVLAQSPQASDPSNNGLEYPRPDNDATDSALTSRDIENTMSSDANGSTRDAVGVPRQYGTADAEEGRWGKDIPFPPQDVSDDNLETFADENVPYPSGAPDRMTSADETARADENPMITEGEQVPSDIERYQNSEAWERDRSGENRRVGSAADRSTSDGAADDVKRTESGGATASVSSEDVFQEGEQVPADIERYQGSEAWERDRTPRDRAARGSTGRNIEREGGRQLKSAERGPAGAWDGRGVGRSLDRGQLHPNRSADEDRSRTGSATSAENKTSDAGLQLARAALKSARTVAPEARFASYRFEVEDRQRIVEISGVDRDTSRRVEVDVYPDGQVESVAHEVPLSSVPREVRVLVEGGIPGFRPVRALRSIGFGFEVQYEIDGYAAGNKPVSVEVQPNAVEMKVSVWNS